MRKGTRSPDRRRTWTRLRGVRRRWWAALAVLVVALAGAGAWLVTAGGQEGDTQRITATVSRGTYRSTVSATGTITPKRDADLAFTSAGTVTAVPVEVGDKVVKGDVLARIDDAALVAQRDAAAAQVTAAQAQLSEDAGGSATRLAADRASLAAARSRLAQAEEAVDGAALRAPFSGTVSAVGYEVGDTVGGSAPGGSGQSAAITVISPRRLLVEAPVSATDVTRLKTGLQAEITPTGGGDVVYGTVSEVSSVATASDSGAAQFPVTIEVTGTPAGLYPGSSASVAITVAQATDVLAVPTAAVRTGTDGVTYVNVVKSGKNGKNGTSGKSVRTPVKLGSVYGAQTEVVSGLAEGDVIEILSITGRRGTGDRGGPTRDLQLPAGGSGGAFPGGGTVPPGGVVIQGNPG